MIVARETPPAIAIELLVAFAARARAAVFSSVLRAFLLIFGSALLSLADHLSPPGDIVFAQFASSSEIAPIDNK